MRRPLCFVVLAAVVAASSPAPAQTMGAGTTPIAVDLKKVAVGSWAEYSMQIGGMSMRSRWALVARDAQSATMEMSMEGGPMAMMGGKMAMKMVMAPDPTSAPKPIKRLVMQMGANDPMEMPLDMPNMPAQKFQKPDPKKLVGKEEIKVAGGTYKTSHYRDEVEGATVDAWISEDVPPLGLIRAKSTPKAGAKGPMGQPMPPVTLELTGRGKDAKPTITKPAKPFDAAKMFGGMGGRGHGAAGPGGPGGPGGPPPAAPPPAKPQR